MHQSMAALSPAEMAFVQKVASNIAKRGRSSGQGQNHLKYTNSSAADLRVSFLSENYEDTYWFIGQLFEPNWTPKDTLEYAPEVSYTSTVS
jgi:hypothetical protein